MNMMSEELATVIQVDGDHAWVSCERRSACSSCHQQSDCGTGLVSKAIGPGSQRVRVRLSGAVRPGDQIRIGIARRSLLSSAVLVYLLPLFSLLAGALLGQLWLRPMLMAGEGATILATLAGGALGFALVHLLAPRLGGDAYAPRMLGSVIPTRCHP
ncbi:positive regulator of sigma(E), RseC/MucC [Aeromonas sp. RU39B]|jgi:sigma-E factor negative regulatory protein RseC|nr:positive regulator of sigma(E), RseC/MucC [Aeromonas sp. RU39B]